MGWGLGGLVSWVDEIWQEGGKKISKCWVMQHICWEFIWEVWVSHILVSHLSSFSLPYPVSRLPFHVSRLPSPVSLVLSPVYHLCLLSLISHISFLIFSLLSTVSYLPFGLPFSHLWSLVSCLPSPFSCLPTLVSHLPSPISCLLFAVYSLLISCLLSPVSRHLCLISRRSASSP